MATITLCMIARNEEKLIAQAIESVKDFVDEIIVVDTGSTDKTPSIARELGAEIHHSKWNEDFSQARNFAIEKASSDWILAMDADEEIFKEDADKLMQMKEQPYDAYIFIQKNLTNTQGFGFIPEARKGFSGFYPSFIIRMFRTGKGIRYEGFVHETVDASLAKIKAKIGFSNAVIYHYQELKGAEHFREKQLRYAEQLEKGIDNYPNKAKAYHDIGISNYRFRKDYQKAIDSFTKSIEINPKNVTVLNDLASAYAQTGNYEKALENYGNALAIRPEPSTLHNIGLLHEQLGSNEQAIMAYEEAIRLNHPKKAALQEKIRKLQQKDGKQ
ncbi:glycosyltransferase [Candidatus Woesearchaeota archaeon]|nr:glycosyltransferase [Candidatus Woesearchaeota archaeon]